MLHLNDEGLVCLCMYKWAVSVNNVVYSMDTTLPSSWSCTSASSKATSCWTKRKYLVDSHSVTTSHKGSADWMVSWEYNWGGRVYDLGVMSLRHSHFFSRKTCTWLDRLCQHDAWLEGLVSETSDIKRLPAAVYEDTCHPKILCKGSAAGHRPSLWSAQQFRAWPWLDPPCIQTI